MDGESRCSLVMARIQLYVSKGNPPPPDYYDNNCSVFYASDMDGCICVATELHTKQFRNCEEGFVEFAFNWNFMPDVLTVLNRKKRESALHRKRARSR